MKTIGLIGGMSWESTSVYYQLINKKIKSVLGDNHSAKIVMISVDFHEIAKLQHDNNWKQLSVMMVETAKRLEKAGADFVVLCTNTMHKVSADIENNISVPFLHIADAIAAEIVEKKIKKVALLGTKFTMEQDFLKEKITSLNIEIIIPNEAQRQVIHDIIYNELTQGIINADSRKKYTNIIDDLMSKGAEGIILGCTEIGLLITNEFTNHLLFDTTAIHAEKAALMSLV